MSHSCFTILVGEAESSAWQETVVPESTPEALQVSRLWGGA